MNSVFAKEMDDAFLDEVKVEQAIDACKDAAKNKVKKLVAQIQNINLDKDDNKHNVEEYIQQCANNLIQLEYLNKHINYKTTVYENQSDNTFNADSNELSEYI